MDLDLRDVLEVVHREDGDGVTRLEEEVVLGILGKRLAEVEGNDLDVPGGADFTLDLGVLEVGLGFEHGRGTDDLGDTGVRLDLIPA
ncbi:hypothetical protein D3C86_1584450 [compost metagenome]